MEDQLPVRRSMIGGRESTSRDPAGRVVGQYEITSEIGRGGAAVVYLARQLDLDRLVALKELRVSSAAASDFAQRFLRESRLASSLSHPSIVTVYEYFEHDGVPYIVMEYLKRGSLRPYVGNLTPAALAGVLEGVLGGLTCGEASSIVHRDLKPENIMVTSDGRVKLADFGIAKATQDVSTDRYVTAAGMTVGTPSYMAPEQALGEPVGPWTDLYSVGVMTWEHLVGHVPFAETTNPTAILLRHVNERIPAATSGHPDIDPGLSRWVESLVANDPRERTQSAAEAWDELERLVVTQLGPMWRRDSRLKPRDALDQPVKVVTPEPAERFGTYPIIEKSDPERPLPPTPISVAPAYHTYLGEGPRTPPGDAPPIEPMGPPVSVRRVIQLHPPVVRVRPTEQAGMTATLDGAPVSEATWELAGDASAFATVRTIAGGARVEVEPGLGEPPLSSSLEVRCLEHGAVVGVATGSVEVLPAEATQAVPQSAQPPTRAPSRPDAYPKPLWQRLGGSRGRIVGLAALLVFAIAVLEPIIVPGGTEVTAPTTINIDNSQGGLAGSITGGTKVRLACLVTSGVDRGQYREWRPWWAFWDTDRYYPAGAAQGVSLGSC